MKLLELHNRLQSRKGELNVNAIVGEVMGENSGEVLALQKIQLRKGRNKDGGYLPRYRDDPFFKTVAQAIAYENWKAKWADPQKPREVMDFYINGFYYNSLKLFIGQTKYEIASQVSFASSVSQKTGDTHLGLNRESADEFMRKVGRNGVLLRLVDITGIRRR